MLPSSLSNRRLRPRLMSVPLAVHLRGRKKHNPSRRWTASPGLGYPLGVADQPPAECSPITTSRPAAAER